jgi:ankyrin repeat protein
VIDLNRFEPLSKPFGVKKGGARVVYFQPFDRKFKNLQKEDEESLYKTLIGAAKDIRRRRKELEDGSTEVLSSLMEATETAVRAARMGEVAAMERALKEHPELLVYTEPREMGRTLLHIAAASGKGSSAVTRFLLAKGANVSSVDMNGDTPLHLAGRAGCIESVEVMIPFDPDLETRNNLGRTAVMEAHRGWVELQQSGHGLAPQADHLHVAKRLLDVERFYPSNVAPPVPAWKGSNASMDDLPLLHVAARSRSPMLMKILLAKDADPGQPAFLGLTPVHLVLDSGEWHVQISKFILTRGPSRRFPDGIHSSLSHWGLPLSAAIVEGFHKTYNRTLLDEALHDWAARLLGILFDDNKTERTALDMATARDKYGMTPLHYAAFHGDYRSIQLLVDKGADVNAKADNGHTPVMLAASRNYRRARDLLLELGARQADLEGIKFYGQGEHEQDGESDDINDDDDNDDDDVDREDRDLCGSEQAPSAGGAAGSCGGGKPARRTDRFWHRAPRRQTRTSSPTPRPLLDGWNHTRSSRFPEPARCDIERRSNLSYAEFEREYLSLGKPVVITDAAEGWPALRLWSKDYMARTFSDTTYKIMTTTPDGRPRTLDLTMAEYLGEYHGHASQAPRGEPSYLFDGYFEDRSPRLMEDAGRDITRGGRVNLRLSQPYFDTFDYFTYQLVVGPAGAGANPHFHHTTWNVLITGAKLWYLWPPGESFYSTSHPTQWWEQDREASAHQSRPFVCMQYPGDLFFLPDMWGHFVINTKDSVAVAESTFFGRESLTGLPLDI